MRASVLLLVSLMVVGSMAWPQWMMGMGRPSQEARGQIIQSLQSGSWKMETQLRHTQLNQMSAEDREGLKFMAEFSRFMNYRIPHLLQEFANRKRITSTKKKIMLAQRMMRQSRRQARTISTREEGADEEAAEETGSEDESDPTIADAVSGVVETVGESVGEVLDTVGDNVENVVDTVVDGTVDVADAVDPTGTVGDVVEGATGAASEIGEDAAALAEDIIDALTSSGTNVVDLFQDIISSVGEVLEDTIPPSAWNYMCLATWWPLHEEHCSMARCAACGPAVTSASEVCKRSFGLDVASHKCVQTVMGEGFCNYCIDDYL